MSKRLPVQSPTVTRVVQYVETPPQRPQPVDLLVYAAGLVAQQDRVLAERRRADYAEWRLRQAHFSERDRRFRRFFLGFGAVAALAVLGGGWLLCNVLAGWPVLVIGAALVAGVPVVVAGGHRCITVVQHWH